MDVQKYLNRINFEGKIVQTTDCLGQLQKCHLLHIPFENLDIHWGRKIVLEPRSIFTKIVEENRGGFCYELNGLFYALLSELGFKTTIISGRVYDDQKGYGREFDHMALIVQLEKEAYLVDVGFGEFVFFPLKMKLNEIQSDERGDFFIDQFEGDYLRVNKIVDQITIPQYIFKTKPRVYSDFETMCNYHQTSPESHFTHKKFIGIPTLNGRTTLIGSKLKIIHKGKIEERIVDSAEWQHLLIKHFKYK